MHAKLFAEGVETLPIFPFKGRYSVRVLSVIDGDTLNVAFDHNGTIFRYKLRLNGIDTPELRNPACAKYATRCKEYVQSKVEVDKVYTAEFLKFDKYSGRIIGDILFYTSDEFGEQDIPLTNFMLNNGYAMKYAGGTKPTDAQWAEFYDGK